MKHLDVPSFFPNGAPFASMRRVAETGQDEACSQGQARPLAGGGFLTPQIPFLPLSQIILPDKPTFLLTVHHCKPLATKVNGLPVKADEEIPRFWLH